MIVYDFVAIGCHDCCIISMLLRSFYCVSICHQGEICKKRTRRADLCLNLVSLSNKVSINHSISLSLYLSSLARAHRQLSIRPKTRTGSTR